MSDKYRGTKEYALIYAELIRAARYRGTVTYQELADLVGLPLSGNHMSNELGGLLGSISEDEIARGRPMLSAIAVTVAGKPGGGFYGLARQTSKLASEHPADEQAFWEAERKAVYKTWQRTFEKA